MKPFPPHFIPSPILLVDDGSPISESLGHLLVSDGFTIRTAANRNEAFDLIRLEHVELVIMTIMAPVTEGIATIIGIRAIDPKLKIVVISGGTGDFLPLAKSLGASAVLQFPCEPGELAHIIQEMLEPKRQVMAS